MLHRNSLRLLKLVNGLLDFVRIEVGRMHANYQPTDLSLLTAQLASVFRSAVERAGLKLIVDCPPLPEPVYVDREMWEKIVLNLLSNALKATFEGEIRVSVSSNESGALLTVQDTGTGIPENELPHLFERFNRIEGARSRSHEGSGIGLALVHELVELHGGKIIVESEVGSGTTFKVHLRFGHEHLSHGDVASESASLARPPGINRRLRAGSPRLAPRIRSAGEAKSPVRAIRMTNRRQQIDKPVVLLVDDNADMREYVRSLLVGRFEVVATSNGRARSKKFAGTAPISS